jgi:integration host factor subunit beta
MNKSDLIFALSTKENLTEKIAFEIINIIFDGFTDTLKKGGRIEIRRFGSLTVREYGAYSGRNPKTGAKTQVGAKKLPFFKVGKCAVSASGRSVENHRDCGTILYAPDLSLSVRA